MVKYKNAKTGRVVEVPDEAPTRTGRPRRQRQWAQKLARMAKAKRWTRVGDGTPVGEGSPRTAKKAQPRK